MTYRIGFAVSSVVHLSFAALIVAAGVALDSRTPLEKPIPLKLSMFQDAPPPPQPPQVMEAPKPEPIKQVVKPEPVRAPEPKPVQEPEPLLEATPVPAPEPVQEAVIAEPQPVVAAQPAPVAPPAPLRDIDAIEREKMAYLASVVSSVEKHKFYPNAARRRGIEGVVNVSFVLVADGNVKNIKADGAHDMLCQAAEDAVRKSLPFPPPSDSIYCPLKVEYRMAFTLN